MVNLNVTKRKVKNNRMLVAGCLRVFFQNKICRLCLSDCLFICLYICLSVCRSTRMTQWTKFIKLAITEFQSDWTCLDKKHPSWEISITQNALDKISSKLPLLCLCFTFHLRIFWIMESQRERARESKQTCWFGCSIFYFSFCFCCDCIFCPKTCQ